MTKSKVIKLKIYSKLTEDEKDIIKSIEHKGDWYYIKLNEKAMLRLKRFVQFSDVDKKVSEDAHLYPNHDYEGITKFSDKLHAMISRMVGDE